MGDEIEDSCIMEFPSINGLWGMADSFLRGDSHTKFFGFSPLCCPNFQQISDQFYLGTHWGPRLINNPSVRWHKGTMVRFQDSSSDDDLLQYSRWASYHFGGLQHLSSIHPNFHCWCSWTNSRIVHLGYAHHPVITENSIDNSLFYVGNLRQYFQSPAGEVNLFLFHCRCPMLMFCAMGRSTSSGRLPTEMSSDSKGRLGSVRRTFILLPLSNTYLGRQVVDRRSKSSPIYLSHV